MSFASINPIEVPPYQLKALVPSVIDAFGAAQQGVDVSVTCAQALGSELYVGCSDGSLLRYALQSSSDYTAYTLLSHQTLPTRKGIDKIVIAPSISRALILTDHQVHIFVIPSLDPDLSVKPIRNIISIVIDEHYTRLPISQPSNAVDPIEFCAIKRQSIMLFSLKERLICQREWRNINGQLSGRRIGKFLCVADKDVYNMADLVTESMIQLLPIVQNPDESPGRIRPSITVVNENEFLLASSMGVNAMGLFVTGSGDPVRGTLEWPSYPESVCMDYPYSVALMQNHTIEIHNIETQAIAQIVSSPDIRRPRSPASGSSLGTCEPLSITSSSTYYVPSTERTELLRTVSVRVHPEMPEQEDSLEPTPGSGLTPPHPPKKDLPGGSPSSSPLPTSNVLVLHTNAIYSLVPSTLISQVESLLESHRIEEAVDLTEQRVRKLMRSPSDEKDEVRYIWQRIGFKYFSEALFEDAGRHLLNGEVDPRLLVKYFPELRGNLLKSTPVVDVFAGVAEHLPSFDSIDELVRNYAPHIKPDVQNAPPTAELRRQLCSSARDMLASYLRSCRTRRLLGRGATDLNESSLNAVVDTVLLKILAESESTAELYKLIDETNDIVIEEVEEVLAKNGQYNSLCKLFAKRGDDQKLLDVLSKLVDGTWTDEDVPDPLTKMIEILSRTSSRSTLQRWVLWIIQRNADQGLRLLISRDSKRASKADDLALLAKVKAVNPDAGTKYLEYLVLQKRIEDRNLHDELAGYYIDRLISYASDESTSKLWRAKASSFTGSRNDTSFLSYFASTTPESDARNMRLKTTLFLQGSELYDMEEALERIEKQDKILRLEKAILFGKLGRHEEALTTLVHGLHDPTSAEAYCTLGGIVVPAKVAVAIGESCGLQRWAALVTGVAPALGLGSTAGSVASTSSLRQKVVDEKTRRELLKVLLRVYMNGGEAMANRTSRLLNSQAMNLDVVDVVNLVPADWPLRNISSFLARSFRRTLHLHHEGNIVKAIASGQNLEVVEKTHLILRDQGSVIEEAVDDDGEEGGEKDFSEKVDVHEPDESGRTVTEIHIEPDGSHIQTDVNLT